MPKKVHFNFFHFNMNSIYFISIFQTFTGFVASFMVLYCLQLCQIFFYTRLLTKKLQTIIHLIKPKITCQKKVHFNFFVLHEFNLLRKYMLEFYWICCKFYGNILSTIVPNFIYTRLLTKKLQTIIHLIKPKLHVKKNSL